MSDDLRVKRRDQLAPDANYELLAKVASGGMGAVYVARARTADKSRVAIKRAHAHLLEDPGFRDMFAAEARLASRVRHRNVVGVREVDESEGELLLVMDYVESASLAELISAAQDEGRKLPVAVSLRVLVDAARGLHAAHVAADASGKPLGIVHRDVSPHNVLVGLDGVARIVDFGVAKAIDQEGLATQAGTLKGKTAYMAPEYVAGRRASPQSDVFSLGVVAWEALTSRRLFRASDDITTMRNVLEPTPAPRVGSVVSIDPKIDAVIARALEKERLSRLGSALELAEAIERVARTLDLFAEPAEVGALVEGYAGASLRELRTVVAEALGVPVDEVNFADADDGIATVALSRSPAAGLPRGGGLSQKTLVMPGVPLHRPRASSAAPPVTATPARPLGETLPMPAQAMAHVRSDVAPARTQPAARPAIDPTLVPAARVFAVAHPNPALSGPRSSPSATPSSVVAPPAKRSVSTLIAVLALVAAVGIASVWAIVHR